MKIDRVIFAWDGNPNYKGLFELQCRAWPALGVIPTLMFVGDRALCGDTWRAGETVFLPSDDTLPHGVAPVRNWQSTMPLVWGQRLFPGETIMTSGIDQIPLNSRFLEELAGVPDTDFVVGFGRIRSYGPLASGYGCLYYPSSHMAAGYDTWMRVLAPCPEDFSEFLRWSMDQGWPVMWGEHAPHWGMDEAVISNLIAMSGVEVNMLGARFFEEWDASRLGRASPPVDWKKLASGSYSELHTSWPPSATDLEIVSRVFAGPP